MLPGRPFVTSSGEVRRSSWFMFITGVILTLLLFYGALKVLSGYSDNSLSRFVMFIVTVAVWYFALGAFFLGDPKNLYRGKLFWREFGSLFLWLMPLVVFVYVLSGFWSWDLVLFLLAGLVISWGCKRILFIIFGSRDPSWLLQQGNTYADFGMRYPRITDNLESFDAIVVTLFPLACAFAYFSYDYPSPELTEVVLQTTLGLYILSGGVMYTARALIALSSPHIDENTRARVFLYQTSGLIPLAMILSLAFWAFGLGGRGIELGGVSLSVSWGLIGLLIGYFAISGLIPYLVGYYLAKREQLAMVEDLSSWYRMMKPADEDYVAQLTTLNGQLSKKVAEASSSNSIISLYEDNEECVAVAGDPERHDDNGEITYSLRGQDYPRYSEGAIEGGRRLMHLRDVEPRLRSWLKLVELQRETERIAEEIQALETPGAQERRALRYGLQYQDLQEDLRKEAEQLKHAKPRLIVVLGFIAGIILSSLVVDAAQKFWSTANQFL